MMLTRENSWRDEGGLWQDPDLATVRGSGLTYRPRPIEPELCAAPNVLTLRGPRRVGKTVSVKLLIAELIEAHGWDPRTIAWTSPATHRTLNQAESTLRAIVARDRPRLLCIDEVTALTGWQRVVKRLRDDGTNGDSLRGSLPLAMSSPGADR